MKTYEITYRREDWTITGIMRHVRMTLAECVVVAQKYMDQFSSIVAASVTDGQTETVVSKTTEWQKRNG